VEYVRHVVSSTGISFTHEKRLKILNFPRPQTQKALLQFANYFRDHVPHMTEMVKPLRDMIPLRKYKGGGPLLWDQNSIEAFEYCQQAIKQLYFVSGFNSGPVYHLRVVKNLSQFFVGLIFWLG